jgi:hypothetical protein
MTDRPKAQGAVIHGTPEAVFGDGLSSILALSFASTIALANGIKTSPSAVEVPDAWSDEKDELLSPLQVPQRALIPASELHQVGAPSRKRSLSSQQLSTFECLREA